MPVLRKPKLAPTRTKPKLGATVSVVTIPQDVRVEWVTIGDLRVDESYQRALSRPKVLKIASEFDPDYMGIITVNEHPDGTLTVIDGGHRIAALYHMGWADEQKVLAQIHEGASHQREAQVFVGLNTNQTKPKVQDRHRADVEAGDEAAIAIQGVLDKYNLEVVNTPKKRGMRAIGTCYTLYRFGGAELVDKAVGTMYKAYTAETPERFFHDLMLALGGIYLIYPKIRTGRIIDTMKELGLPKQIVGRARTIASMKETQANTEMANLILKLYNKGLRSNRLQLFDESKNLFKQDPDLGKKD